MQPNDRKEAGPAVPPPTEKDLARKPDADYSCGVLLDAIGYRSETARGMDYNLEAALLAYVRRAVAAEARVAELEARLKVLAGDDEDRCPACGGYGQEVEGVDCVSCNGTGIIGYVDPGDDAE